MCVGEDHPVSLTVATLAQLRTSAGATLLAEATARAGDDLVRTTAALRATGQDPELVAAALTTVRLRQRAAVRLGEPAHRMFFTPDGAEQITRPAVAAHRATRLCRHLAGRGPLLRGRR